MSKQLVQVCLPGPASSVHATFISLSASVTQLIEQLLLEDGPQIRRALCGKGHTAEGAADIDQWRIQRVLKTTPNKDWTDQELDELPLGLLGSELTIEQALQTTGVVDAFSLSTSPRPDQPQRQFSDFVLTQHLQTPSLRLCYLPNAIEVEFQHVPGFRESWKWKMFVSADMTAGETVEAIVEELGVRKVVVHGHKTARVEYVVQIVDPDQATQTLTAPTRLLPLLLKNSPNPSNLSIRFTVSPTWLKKAGTVAFAISGAHSSDISTNASKSSSSSSSSKPRIASRDGGGWRPSSLFGGLWGGEQSAGSDETSASKQGGESKEPQAEEEEEEGGGDTIKGEKASTTVPPSTATSSSLAARSATQSRTRLSALFTDWIAPEASTSPSPSSSEPKSRIAVGPRPMSVDLSKRFSSFTPGDRSSMMMGVQETLSEEGEEDAIEDLDAELETLMDDLGMKEAQRGAMRQLPEDRKRFLILQHRQSQPREPEPLRPTKTGPADDGILSNVKRFSLATVGWGAVTSDEPSPALPIRPMTTFGSSSIHSELSTATHSRSDVNPSTTIQTQPTGSSSSWSSWWSTASNATGTGQGGAERAKDTPQFYVDQLSSTKISQRSLVKHLIALRVRLSTAKLSWAQDFLGPGQGLEALEALLGKIALKKINGGESATEEDRAVQSEILKCLRVLLNTDIGFAQVVSRSTLITYVTYTLYTTSNKLRALVADVLAALCVLSVDEGHRAVLSSFSDARIAYNESFRFEYLIGSIRLKEHRDESDSEIGFDSDNERQLEEEEADEAELWEYRTAAMSLVNSIANSANDLEQRMVLREEFARRGLNEAMAGLRYVNPPEYFLTQLTVYTEERQEDQEELHERTVGHARNGESEVPLSDLIRLAHEHEELYPKLVDTVKKYIKVFERKDVDEQLRSDLITVLDNFVEHAAHLEDFDQGWRVFMKQYLSSVQHIVGQQAIIRASRIADTAAVPTSFIEELETLRAKVDELSEERTALKAELNEQIAEVNILRALPVDRNIEPGETSPRSPTLKAGDKENFSGVISRLVQKEKEVIELQSKLANIEHSTRDESDAKKERSNQSKRWESLLQEIGSYKVKMSTLENEIDSRDKEIKYLKRTLESVYSRFQATVSNAVNGPSQYTRPEAILEVDSALESTAPHNLEALAQRDTEIENLKKQLLEAQEVIKKTQQSGPVFARTAPPPPFVVEVSKVSPIVTGSTSLVVSPAPTPSPPPPPPPPPPPLIRNPSSTSNLQTKKPSLSAAPPSSSDSSQFPSSSQLPKPDSPPPPPPPPPPLPQLSASKSPSVVPDGPGIVVSASSSLKSASPTSVNVPGPPPPPPPPIPSARISIPPALNTIPRSVKLKPKLPQKKMKPFFWTKLPPTRVGQSIWSETEVPELDLADLEKESEVGAPMMRVAQADDKIKKKKEVATLLGHTRAQNIAIMLARLRLPHSAVRDAILRLDDDRLSVDNLKAIKHYSPTPDEIEAIRSFEGEISSLTSADQFFNEIIVFPRLNERLSCMLYRRRLEIEMEELKPDLSMLRTAASELRESRRFKNVLQTVLAIGNTLNASTFRGGASGFSLDSLLRLRDTKSASASPGTPTLLHYLVRVLNRNDPTALNYLDESPHVDAASRISTVTVMQTVHSLVSGVSQIEEELEAIKNSKLSPPEDRFVEVMKNFLRHASPAMSALSTLAANLDKELRATISYFGGDPQQTKPEELFNLVAQFSSALLRASTEVKTFDEKANATRSVQGNETALAQSEPAKSPRTPPPRTPTKNSSLTPSHLGSVERDRPLSRIFLSS
ncbi:hypothetical protein JCM3765_004650 [Sporobolomyces pararoseus]